MSKPYLEGKVWSIRFQVRKQDIYLTGYSSKTEAGKAAEKKRQDILGMGMQRGRGPEHTTLAEALQTYALEKLPHLKGAYQEANRINRYLRAAGLDTIKATEIKPEGMATTGKTRLWHLELVAAESGRCIPNSLRTHRDSQAQRTAASDQLRAQLARTKVAQVTRHQMQCLITAMLQEQCAEAGNPADGHPHYEPATLHNERALVRAFFNYAFRIWAWTPWTPEYWSLGT